ncbi:MAG TPA: hypothetical protein VGJ83_05040 [Gemmatimonadales bacterium]|jgi:hypothetical protein
MFAQCRWSLTAALSGALLLPAPAAKDWELLGARRVSFAVDHDVIDVGVREGLFTAVRIDVEGGSLEMYNIRLTFGNGDTWSPNTRVLFREGSWSRTIDLPGPARVIQKIEFWYRSRLRRGQAVVRVFGRQAEGAPAVPTVATPAPAPAPAPPASGPTAGPAAGPATAPAGWDHVGMRQVDFRVDHDAIVAVGQGAFRALRIDVESGDLELFDVKITFGNGETFSPATRLYFRPGSSSRVIDLPGDARIIRRIDFFYRSVFGGAQGRATIHVYGRR